MAGLSSWGIADAMEDHCGRKPSHSSMLNRARVRWTIPPRERRPVAVDWNEAAEKADGREVYVCAAINVDTGELPAIKASGPVVQELHGRPPLPEPGARGPHEQTGVRRGRGPRYSWAFRELGLEHCRGAFGDRSGVERFFDSLKRRTSASFKDVNAGRSRVASLDRIVNVFFLYYNGPRFQ